MLRPLLILFARAPIPGRVKTRLCPPLTPAEAAGLHSALVMDAGNILLGLSASVDTELSTDVATQAWPDITLARSLQTEGDLGSRLFGALERGLARGHSRVLVLGSDSPGLPRAHLTTLIASKADVALGPTPDGGFYAIACRVVHTAMFAGVRWSSEHTLADVFAAASGCGLTVECGPAWFDVDVQEDLLQLLQRSDLPINTTVWLQHYREVPR